MINLSKLIFILIILNFPFPSLCCLIDIGSCEVNCTWLFASLIISLKMNICILFNIPYIQYICNICTVCIYICIYMHRYIYIYFFFFSNQNFGLLDQVLSILLDTSFISNWEKSEK